MNSFYLYDTLTRKKKLVVPQDPNLLTIYACGMTIYDDCHLGHARSMLVFDILVKYLRAIGTSVLYVRNITDIDDKIIKRANELSCSISELTTKYIDSMHADMQMLGMIRPDIEPRATSYITSIINFIAELIKLGYAYQTKDGDICFEINKFAEYGKLSNQNLDNLQQGIRIEVDDYKRNPADFVLWKAAKVGEPHWSSPWGDGRPGWHIECSAMVLECLGKTIDIHGGGQDLCFPHHENEIAQSEALTKQSLANHWMHVGLLKLNSEKMAKSTGNFLTIKQALSQYHPEILRYFLLSGHYRSSLNYSAQNLEMAQKSMNRLYQAYRVVESADHLDYLTTDDHSTTWVIDFLNSMNDDLNTPAALSVLFSLSHEVNRSKNANLAVLLRKMSNILGLLKDTPDNYFKYGMSQEKINKIEELIHDRQILRKNKDWQGADLIREQLFSMDIIVSDDQDTTSWFLQ